MLDHTGQQFGNYRILRLLGQGGFARVYLGAHQHLGTQVAIKVLQGALFNAGDIEKFRQEARIIANLTHPNIVRVLDFGVEEGVPYLVMDYAPNGSLRTHLPQKTPLPPASIQRYVKQTADALQHAHDHHLIHRDIKPENMLLGRQHEVLLSDFGVALISQTSVQQSTQTIVGTAPYIAPEQWSGHPRPASDQYALGVVAYEWLCGERPFTGGFIEVASQHVAAQPPSLCARVPGLSPDVEQAVFIALAKDPKDRFGSIGAFGLAFEHACQSSATLAPGAVYPVAGPAPARPGATPASTPQAPPLLSPVQPTPPPIFHQTLGSAPTLRTPPPYAQAAGGAPATPVPALQSPIFAQQPLPGQTPPAGFPSGASGYQGYSAPQASYPAPSPALAPTFAAAPVSVSPAPPEAPAEGGRPVVRVLLYILALLALLAGVLSALLITGIIHLSSSPSQPPQPTLEVRGPALQGGTPVGAAGSTLRVSGQRFASNSRVTFLLDAQPAPDVPDAQSDGAGAINVNLTVPMSWPLGQHTLSAQDAQQHRPQRATTMLLVEPGQSGTPGPNGAPADNATFVLTISIQPHDAITGQQLSPMTITLRVTGRPDPAGGMPCQAQDTGQPQQVTNTDPKTGTQYQNTSVWTCSGGYTHGHLDYTETTLTNYAIFLNTGTRCDSRVPFIFAHLTGDFSSPTSIGGAYNSDAIVDTCTNGNNPASHPEQGTWSGTVTSG